MNTLTSVTDWKAPTKLEVKGLPQGMSGKYFNKRDVERRLDEGWVIVNDPLKAHKEGGPIDKAKHFRSMILMMMPLEMVQKRNAFYREKHLRRVRATARGGAMTAVGRAATKDGATTEDGRPLAGAIGRGLTINQGVHTNEGLTHTDNIHIPVDAHPNDIQADEEVIRESREERRKDKEDVREERSSDSPKRKRR